MMMCLMSLDLNLNMCHWRDFIEEVFQKGEKGNRYTELTRWTGRQWNICHPSLSSWHISKIYSNLSLCYRLHLKDMFKLMRENLFGKVYCHCKPADCQQPGKNETAAAGNPRYPQTGVHEKNANSSNSKEDSSSNVIPKRTTVFIMVAPPPDLQQVG